jgi:hypothetical protein
MASQFMHADPSIPLKRQRGNSGVANRYGWILPRTDATGDSDPQIIQIASPPQPMNQWLAFGQAVFVLAAGTSGWRRRPDKRGQAGSSAAAWIR